MWSSSARKFEKYRYFSNLKDQITTVAKFIMFLWRSKEFNFEFVFRSNSWHLVGQRSLSWNQRWQSVWVDDEKRHSVVSLSFMIGDYLLLGCWCRVWSCPYRWLKYCERQGWRISKKVWKRDKHQSEWTQVQVLAHFVLTSLKATLISNDDQFSWLMFLGLYW